MVFTQLPDAEIKLIPARTQIKYCMSFNCCLTCGFAVRIVMISPRIVMISPRKSNFWDPKMGDFDRERCKTVEGFSIFSSSGHLVQWLRTV